jgi:cyclase
MRFKAWTLAAASIVFAAGAYAAQQQDFSKIEVKTTNLGNNTYMLEGAGGNVTVAVGTDGIIVVDAQFAPMHDKLKAAIAQVSNQPVKYLINTHYHGDHTGGNEAFGKEGVTIVAHQNLKVVHIAAHTDTDSVVYFPDANVLAVGDTGAPNRYPNMALGGSIKGMIDGTQTYLNMANDQTKIIPGHAPVSTKAQFQAYHDMLVQIRDRVAKLKSEGKSVDEAVAAKPLADLQAKVNQTDMVSENLVRAVYAQV